MVSSRPLLSLILLGFVSRPLQFAAAVNATIVPAGLRCEFQERPPAVQTANPRFDWELRATDPRLHGLRQLAFQLIVSSTAELAAGHEGDLWDSGRVDSGKAIQIEYAGKPLRSSVAYYWSVRVWDQNRRASQWSAPAQFRMGLVEQADWKAKWISTPGSHGGHESAPLAMIPPERSGMPIFRHEFSIDKPVAEAIAFVCGLGQYELHLNGATVGDAVLTPGWTNYRKTVFYNTYDVTQTLRRGRNSIGIMLGNGMFNVQRTPGRYTKLVSSFGTPQLIFQAEIRFTDGTTSLVVSDSSWRVQQGPITFSSPYGGEDYDARLAPEGWDRAGFDDRQWMGADEVRGPGGQLVAQENPPIEIQHVYDTEHVTEPEPGIHVYDLGQNFSGWPEVTVRGPAGSTIKLIPGELLDRSGFVNQKGSGGPQWFSYTLKGGGVETWHPRFSYYGFRYVQVELQAPTNMPLPEVLSVKGQFIHADVSKTGKFRCSDELFNKIHQLIDAAVESNTESVLTDCPHREKLGWLEQTHLLGTSVMYGYDVARLYEKISDDMRDAQMPDGLVPDIAPEYVVFPGRFRDSPEWGSAVVLDPWIAYQHYGDLRNLVAHYADMKRYVEYLRSKANNNIISYGLGDWYDIGPGEPGLTKLTSLALTATAVYYQDLITLRDIARLLGNKQDTDQLEDLATGVRDSFNRNLYDSLTHVYDRGSQTAYAMPLALGMVPDGDRSIVLDKLVADIRAHGNHATAGDVGFHYVVAALIQGGRSDVLYDMVSRTDSPSYGYQLKMGATTLTEAWDANPRHSQNHFMLGHGEDWFYRALAGIDFNFSRPADTRIVIRPNPVGNIANASASYHSVLGTIACDWRRERGKFYLDVTIPPNNVAQVNIPTRDPSSVKEQGRPIGESTYIRFIRSDAVAATYGVNSGRYSFSAQE